MIDIVHSLTASGKNTLFSDQLAMRVLAETKRCTISLLVAVCDF